MARKPQRSWWISEVISAPFVHKVHFSYYKPVFMFVLMCRDTSIYAEVHKYTLCCRHSCFISVFTLSGLSSVCIELNRDSCKDPFCASRWCGASWRWRTCLMRRFVSYVCKAAETSRESLDPPPLKPCPWEGCILHVHIDPKYKTMEVKEAEGVWEQSEVVPRWGWGRSFCGPRAAYSLCSWLWNMAP